MDKLNDITEVEIKRRNETLMFLSKLQDISIGGTDELAIAIIIDLFPELKQFIGSGYLKTNNNNKEEGNDVIINLANNLTVNIINGFWKTEKYKSLEEKI